MSAGLSALLAECKRVMQMPAPSRPKVKDYGIYMVYRVHIKAVYALAPAETIVDIAKQDPSSLSLAWSRPVSLCNVVSPVPVSAHVFPFRCALVKGVWNFPGSTSVNLMI